MPPEQIVMPMLTMISSIAAIFIDPKDPRIRWAKPLAVILITLLTVATIYFGNQNQIESKRKGLKYGQDIRSLRDENRALKNLVNDIPKKTVALLKLGYTPLTASTATSEQVSRSKEANIQLNSDIQAITNQDIGRRQSVTVQYFPKDVDPDVVQSTLQKLGFNFKVSKANVLSIPTNAIWFGSKVNIEDVKLVAYTLIRAGVQIKTIKPFRGESANSWASLIQVGADGDYVDSSALRISEIRNTKKFVRRE